MEAQCLQKQRVVAAATAPSKDAAEPLDDATIHCCEALRGISDADLWAVTAATPGPVSGGAVAWALTGAIIARGIIAPDGGEEKLVAAIAWGTTIARALAVRQQFGQSPTGISAGPFEWPAAVLPPPLLRPNGQPGWDATMAYEQKQHRALAAILGRSAGGALSHQTILAVFGLWRIDERRVVARARYAFVFSQTQRRPWRKSIFAELQARVGRDPRFRKQSVTGAIDAALKKLGLAWPKPGVSDGGAARDAPGETAVDSDDEVFVRLLRSRAEIEADAMQWDAAAAAEAAAERAGADDATGADDGRDADVDENRPSRADGDGRASDGEESEAETVEGQPDSTAAQRAWNADVRRRGVALVKGRAPPSSRRSVGAGGPHRRVVCLRPKAT